jgi:hypothetical protein
MSLLRRWFDPIRSRWFFNRPYRQRHLSSEEGLVVYLRFDDAYSYLIIQLLAQLQDLLVEPLKPIQIIIGSQTGELPNQLSELDWQYYSIQDAAILAKQHGFTFDTHVIPPTEELIQQAIDVLQCSLLTGNDYLHLLQDVFHMLWQNQRGKLKTLHQMASARALRQNTSVQYPIRFTDEEVVGAFIQFGGKKYRAIDDFLRFTRRLKRQKLLTGEPIFLINHIEWGEHLVNDPEVLADIQALQAELDLYVVLEDPITWLILAYIKRELADYYNITLRVHALPYQGNDQFDWGMVSRLSKRTDVNIAPFCRPTVNAVNTMAWALFNVDIEDRAELLLQLLQACWCEGLDPEYKPHLSQMLQDYPEILDQPVNIEATEALLQENLQQSVDYRQPDTPVFILHIGEQKYVFNSLYRVWQIESLLAGALDEG